MTCSTNLDKHVSDIHNDGYTVLPGAFSPSEIQSLRAAFEDYFQHGDFINIHGGKSKPDFLKSQQLQNTAWLLGNEKIAALLKHALGEEILFCEHSDAHFNITNHWHKDVELPSAEDPWNDSADPLPYNILKVAIYLQEHGSAKDYALKVRKGSHRHSNVESGEEQALTLQLGDVIVFDCRTTHMGQKNPLTRNTISEFLIGLLRKNQHNSKAIHDYRHMEEHRSKQRLLNRIEYRLLSLLSGLRGSSDRISLFYTFGVPNMHTKLHISSSKTRQDIQNGAPANDEVYDYKSHLDAVDIRY